MLQRDDTALKSYKRLRPSWKQMAREASRMGIGQIDESGATFVGDNVWLLVDATLPDEAREIMENKSRWSGGGLQEFSKALKEHNATLAEQAISTIDVVLAEPIAVRAGSDGKISTWGRDSILILRIENRDIGVNPRAARWVEKYSNDEGSWYAEPDRHTAPLRYIVDNRVVGLLAPYQLGTTGEGWYEWGIEWDEETQRYVEQDR